MIIGLSGYARSGKDTVAEYLVKEYGFAQYSFAEPMKKAMYVLNPIVNLDNNSKNFIRYKEVIDEYGIDNAKTNFIEIRRLLQVFGTEVGRTMFGENFWVDICLNSIHSFRSVISDVRFPNEADEIKKHGGVIWRVNRPDIKPVTRHSSETALDNYKFDAVLNNDKFINDLHRMVDLEITNVARK